MALKLAKYSFPCFLRAGFRGARVRGTGCCSLFCSLLGAALLSGCSAGDAGVWSDEERRIIASLRLASLPPPPPSPSNRVADDPAAARLGQRLFFDTRLSGNGTISCATCHQPERLFTDGLTVSQGLGRTDRNAMSLLGTAYSPWLFWDGRKDSLWSQALAPLESAVEHGGSRVQFVRLLAEDPEYRSAYKALFGELPDTTGLPPAAGPVDDPTLRAAWQALSTPVRTAVDRAFTNLGKALEAYQRLLRYGPSRFDAFAEALQAGTDHQSLFSAEEAAGLKLFIGEAQCINCHNGPLFTNNEFHNTAVLSAPARLPSKGRSAATSLVLADPTNCLGPFSDDPDRSCPELRFMKTGDELIGAHRTPSLRNVTETAPYMHAGQQPTLSAVLEQYNEAPEAMIGHNEAKPLGLSGRQLAAVEAFLGTLSGPIATEAAWLTPPAAAESPQTAEELDVREGADH